MRLPRLLEGELVIRGYPLEMVLADKIVTALAHGSVAPGGRIPHTGSAGRAIVYIALL